LDKSSTDVRVFDRTVRQILRLNYAGEYGAARSCGAQIALARLFHPKVAGFLEDTVSHERRHAHAFRTLMPVRATRPCGATPLWGLGGSLLGALTGLMGANAMLTCTEAVKRTVHAHLNKQLEFLGGWDAELYRTNTAIRDEAVGRHDAAQARQTRAGPLLRALDSIVTGLTAFLIWCSTYGALTRMKHAIAGCQAG
jgi:3-demethoxyubiquinol 3-hydroxylase